MKGANMSKEPVVSVFEQTRNRFREIVEREQLLDVSVSVLAKTLTPEEAIGTPGRRDFPIIVGKERVVEASVLGAKGHAFTDSPREFMGTLKDVLRLDFAANQNRAVYVATLNAVLRHLDMVKGTVHCRDEDPEKCAKEIARFILEKHGKVEVGFIGLNPAIAERLIDTFGTDHVRITDLNADNVGKRRFGVEIWDGKERMEDLVDASDVVVVTGTTLVNGTFDPIWDRIQNKARACLVYGVTVAGISKLMEIERICPYGRDE